MVAVTLGYGAGYNYNWSCRELLDKLTDNMRGVSPLSPPLLLMSAPPSSTSATMMAV